MTEGSAMRVVDFLKQWVLGREPSPVERRIAELNAELARFVSLRDEEVFDLFVTGRWERPSRSS
jgi:hypothetical protein